MNLKITKIAKINKLALEYYRQELLKNSKATEYLYSRISKETANVFNIGFAPPNNYISYKFEDCLEDAVSSGLLISDDYDHVYARFRNRIMFPIMYAGCVAGFGGRTLSSTDPKKYINTPTTILYSKSSTLYGLWKTRAHIVKKNYVILVEGYFDVVSLYENGIKAVAGLCGTALTEQHIISLKRYTNKVYLLYDPDAAGQTAAKKANKLLKKHKMFAGNIELPDGKDPDEFVKKYGKKELHKMLTED